METDKKSSRKSKLKRNTLEWIGIIAVFGILYVTGLHTEVLGTLQRGLLWTGLFNAEQPKAVTSDGPFLTSVDYSVKMTDQNGNIVSLEQFKGDVIFINNWATWCPPCVAEMPTIETLYTAVKENEDIHFLLISQDENMEKAATFMERKDFPMPYYLPATPLPQKFRTSYIPSTFVVAPNGQIIYKKEGIADYSTDSFRNWLIELAAGKE